MAVSVYVELAEPGSEEVQIPNSLLHVDTLRPIFFCKEILEGNYQKQWLKSQNLPPGLQVSLLCSPVGVSETELSRAGSGLPC